MRYAQGGGLTARRRALREQVRLEAAGRFAAGEDNAVVARELRVHVRSVQRWRRAWDAGGDAVLYSAGPPRRPRLDERQWAVVEAELAAGPVAAGWSDQRWTLARVATVIGRRFHISYTLVGVAGLLHRHGWSVQIPARRAVERDVDAVAGWVKDTWPAVERPGRRRERGSSLKTRPDSR